jgi:hypothetical protein
MVLALLLVTPVQTFAEVTEWIEVKAVDEALASSTVYIPGEHEIVLDVEAAYEKNDAITEEDIELVRNYLNLFNDEEIDKVIIENDYNLEDVKIDTDLAYAHFWRYIEVIVKGIANGAYKVAKFLVIDDITTLFGPNSNIKDRGIAALGLLPHGKILKAGKLVILFKNSKGQTLERAVSNTPSNHKIAQNAIDKAKKKTGCNCFTAGTLVQTEAGEEPIESVEIGDRVLAKDEFNENGKLAYKRVTTLFRNQRDDIIKLHVGAQVIETTDNHPFWVEGKGWVFADELSVGNQLENTEGRNLTIEKVEFVKLAKPVTVYNFAVEDHRTYYVTDLGIWVHNTEFNCFILSSNQIQHIGKHIASDFSKQVPFLNDTVLKSKLSKNSFFNPSWTKENIITGVQNGVNEAISKKFTNGYFKYSFKGETIQIYFKNGKFDTAFGNHKLTLAHFGR